MKAIKENKNMTINFEQDKQEDINKTGDVHLLSAQVSKLKDLEDELTSREDQLKKLKKNIELISGEVIPTMMQEMNISTLKLADGSAVEVKPIYGASITVDKKEEAFNWLRNNGLGDLIKNEVMTLKALVRERIEKGLDMPTDLFNVFAGSRTKITRK